MTDGTEPDRTPLQVLVVDDDASLARTLSWILEDEGFAVRTAGTTSQAREVLGRMRPDLVLLDVRLPDGNGLDLLKSIKVDDAGIPVVVLTGASELMTSAVQALRRGVDHILQKPVHRQTLLATLRQALGGRWPEGGSTAGHAMATLAEVERKHIAAVLEHTGFNMRRAARILGISRSTLYRKIDRHGLKGSN